MPNMNKLTSESNILRAYHIQTRSLIRLMAVPSLQNLDRAAHTLMDIQSQHNASSENWTILLLWSVHTYDG